MLALLAVYLIWGSTYLAIRFAIETLPPFLMVGTRLVVAGAVLYGWARGRGAPRPTRFNWGAAAVVGGLLLLGGNGGLAWAEQQVPSGLASLLIAMVPLWMVLLNWIGGDRVRPSGGVAIGLVLGLAGIVLLVGPGELAGGSHANSVGAAALMVSSLSWATGSLYSRRARLPASSLLATAMEMLAGGALLLVAGSVTGEWTQLKLSQVSPRSTLSLGYLVIFGSLVGFTAYTWLLRVARPALVSTYAYVNPVVAVFLGWALGGESLTPWTILAALIIVIAVVLITTYQARGSTREERARSQTSQTVSEVGQTAH